MRINTKRTIDGEAAEAANSGTRSQKKKEATVCAGLISFVLAGWACNIEGANPLPKP